MLLSKGILVKRDPFPPFLGVVVDGNQMPQNYQERRIAKGGEFFINFSLFPGTGQRNRLRAHLETGVQILAV